MKNFGEAFFPEIIVLTTSASNQQTFFYQKFNEQSKNI